MTVFLSFAHRRDIDVFEEIKSGLVRLCHGTVIPRPCTHCYPSAACRFVAAYKTLSVVPAFSWKIILKYKKGLLVLLSFCQNSKIQMNSHTVDDAAANPAFYFRKACCVLCVYACNKSLFDDNGVCHAERLSSA